MKEQVTIGGWVDFMRKVRAGLDRPLTTDEVHDMMQKHYIKGHSAKRAVESLK